MKQLLFILFIFISIGSMAQKYMTPELLWDLKRIGNIQVSPDYQKVLFSQRTYNLEDNRGSSEYFILDLKTKSISKVEGLSKKAQNVVWRPDGKKLSFMTSNERFSTIYEVGFDGAEPKKISNLNLVINEFKYAGNGQRILFTSDVKLDKFHSTELSSDLGKSNAKVYDDLMYRHWSSYATGSYSHVFFTVVDAGLVAGKGIDIMPDEKYDVPLKPFGGLEQVTFSADGRDIAYTCKKSTGKDYALSTNSDIYVYNTSSRETVNLTDGNLGYDTNPLYSKDGKYLAWLSMKTPGFESDKNDIILYNIQSKEKRNLTEAIDLTVSEFIWDDNTEYIYFRASIQGTYQIFKLNIQTLEYSSLTTGDHNYTSLAFAGDKIIGGKQSMNRPTDIYGVKIKNSVEDQLTDVNKAVYDKIQIGKIEKRWVKTTDDKKELVWVIYPPNFDPNKKYPALLYCQGGPQSAVSQFFSYRWNFQLMAANGYIIIAPNRRGLPGFGQEWNDAISMDWGGQAMADYLAAVDELKKEPFIDEKRIGAVGASYGGYSVYYLAGIHDQRFSCFVSHCGLFNLESWYGTTEELFFANHDIGGSYYSNNLPELYRKNSPHRKVNDWNTPMLIFQGEKDYRVPMGQGLEAFQALQLKNIPSRLVLFPDENHWVLSPQNGVFWHRQFYDWLDKYLKK